jgi:hypothetical protein
VEKNWKILTSGNWPDGTAAGDTFDLKWECRLPDGDNFNIRIMDCAGQDLRRLFDGQPPDALKPLSDYLKSAHVVLFLINPADFMDVDDPERALDNQVAIKEAMDQLNREDRQCAIIFTKSDLHQHLETKYGTWDQAAEEIIPYVYSAHISKGDTGVFAVSAVADTDEVVGGNIRVPRKDFQSTGLEELMAWIVESAQSISEDVEAPVFNSQTEECPRETSVKGGLISWGKEPPRSPPIVDPEPEDFWRWLQGVWEGFGRIILLVMGLLVFVYFSSNISGCTAPPQVPCTNCGGDGRIWNWWLSNGDQCPKCHGTGWVRGK